MMIDISSWPRLSLHYTEINNILHAEKTLHVKQYSKHTWMSRTDGRTDRRTWHNCGITALCEASRVKKYRRHYRYGRFLTCR